MGLFHVIGKASNAIMETMLSCREYENYKLMALFFLWEVTPQSKPHLQQMVFR